MRILRKVVRIPTGNTTYVHYNFVVAKPLVYIYQSKKKSFCLQNKMLQETWNFKDGDVSF